MSNQVLNANVIAFIGLSTDYCKTLEQARGSELEPFVNSMLKLLPRLYISATDLKVDGADEIQGYIDSALDEDYYESVRRDVESVMGEHDVYLEVFEEDMKYSDTPVSASVSEGLADIFQSLYNFLDAVKDAPDDVAAEAVVAVSDDFKSYWSTTLCNVLRALNHIAYA